MPIGCRPARVFHHQHVLAAVKGKPAGWTSATAPRLRKWSLKSTRRPPSALNRADTSFPPSDAWPKTRQGRARQQPNRLETALQAHHVQQGRRPSPARSGPPRSSPTARRGGASATRASSASARTGQRAAPPSRKASRSATSWQVPSPSADRKAIEVLPVKTSLTWASNGTRPDRR